MIKVKNIGSSMVTLIAPDYKFRRKLAPGREIPVQEEVYDELTFDIGFQTLVKNGSIRVSGVNAEEKEVIEVENNILSREELVKIFEDNNVTKFAQIIPTASDAMKESIVNIAIEKRIAAAAFTSLINKYCGVDIIKALSTQEV
jgi:hypothetical protein